MGLTSSSEGQADCLLVLAAVALLGAACMPAVRRVPDLAPDVAVMTVWARLESLDSYRFRLRYRTDTPFELGAEIAGRRFPPDREARDVTSWRLGERWSARLVGAGSRQYENDGSGWRRQPRGLETRLPDQVLQVMLGTRPVLVSDEGDKYRYGFSPELRFLDPSGRKRFECVLTVDRRFGLPLELVCRDAGGTAYWELEFDRFNGARSFQVPFVAAARYRLTPRSHPDRHRLGEALRVLDSRLEYLGLRSRFRSVPGASVLELEEDVPGTRLALMASRGVVEIWHAVPESDSLAVGVGRTVEIAGDAAWRARLVERVAERGSLTARLVHDQPEPTIEIELNRSGGAAVPPGELVVLTLDGVPLTAARSTDGRRWRFQGFGGPPEAAAVAAVIVGPISPIDLVVEPLN